MAVVEEARAACAENRWGDAWRLLTTVATDELEIDDLDRLATAAYLIGRDEEGFALWGLAHHRALDEGSVHRALNFGIRVAQGLGFKGDLGRFHGWVDRSARLLADADIDCVEQGYLEHGLGMLRLFEAGDIAGAHAHFVQAGKVGRRFAHRELVTLSQIAEGRMLVYLGELAEGMGLLDESMVSIEARELSPIATGDAYCTVIDACAELLDLERCRSWTRSFVTWCDSQQELVLYRGHCLLHRAEMLSWLSTWPDALDEARRACARLAEPINPAALGAACTIEGDLLRLLGDLEGAAIAYERATSHGRQPQPGLSLLLLAQGRVDAAAAMIRRVLDESEDPLSRARLLGSFIEVMLAAGDVDAAREAVHECGAIAHEIGTPLLRAHAALGAGSVQLADGDPKRGLIDLRMAFNTYNELGVRYDAARARALIADACRALGDHDGAALESAAAAVTLDALRTGSGTAVGQPRALPDGLTEREAEVLRLVASGKTNRAIAEELVISEKTVASHISHVFTKLAVTSRAAATAYAYEHGLVG